MPIDELTRAWDIVVWPLTAKDRDCSSRIGRACQALALDEQRESFEPALWNENGRPLPKMMDDEPVSQVWFAGVHSNVGGSYPDDSLALVPLNWMLEQSEKQGLAFLPDERRRLAEQANWNGPQYDSRKGVGMFYRYAPRNIERLSQEERPGLANWFKKFLPVSLREKFGLLKIDSNKVDISKPKIHHSVFERIEKCGQAYAPINLPKDYAVVRENGNIEGFNAVQTTMPEKPPEAMDRRTRQAYAWNKVWALKSLYVLTFFAILLWIGYPYLRSWFPGSGESTFAPFFGTFSYVLRQIPNFIGKIPGLEFASDWAAGYTNLPFPFASFILLIGFLWLWQFRTQTGLQSEMRAAWHHLSDKGARPAELGKVGWLRKGLAAFLDSRPNAKGEYNLSPGSQLSRWFRIGSEALAVVFFILLVIVLAVIVISRIVFVTTDGFGGICEPSSAKVRSSGEIVEFDPKNPCFDTGFELEDGKKYAIEYQISEDWSDATIYSDVNGWADISDVDLKELNASISRRSEEAGKETPNALQEAPWYMSLFTPFRRHLSVGWYAPMATIDDTWFDRYPLRQIASADDERTAARPMKLRAEFKARQSGRLYLYLNDAVLFLPSFPLEFYSNNDGYACATVVELSAEEPMDAKESLERNCR